MLRFSILAILCCLLSIPTALRAQSTDTFRVERVIGERLLDFTVDPLGNILIVGPQYQIKKLRANGDSVGVFNDVRKYGKLTYIDASNPLKILLYYRDFATIVVLDRFLAVRNVIDLRRLGVFLCRAIGQSFDNAIWVYDEQEAVLKRFQDDGKLIDQSNDFRQLFDPVPVPQSIHDQDKRVFLYDPEKGWYVFDYFGTLQSQSAWKGWTDVQVMGGSCWGRQGEKLYRYTPGTLQVQEQQLSKELAGVSKVQVGNRKLYCLRAGQLFVYTQ
jgi:hypothetical protein